MSTLSEAIKKFTDGQPQTCRKCFAEVLGANMPKHLEWHEKLRRAVDESEMLG